MLRVCCNGAHSFCLYPLWLSRASRIGLRIGGNSGVVATQLLVYVSIIAAVYTVLRSLYFIVQQRPSGPPCSPFTLTLLLVSKRFGIQTLPPFS